VISDAVRTLLPAGPTLIALIGFPAGIPTAPGTAARRSGPYEWVDLDQVDGGLPLAGAPDVATAVVARTWTDLRRAASMSGILPATRHVVIAVTEPPGPLGRLVLVPEQRFVERVDLRREPTGGWAVAVTTSRAVPAGDVLARAVLGTAMNRWPTIPRLALSGAGAAHWRPGDPSAVPTTAQGPLADPGRLIPADLVLRTTRRDSPAWGDPRAKVVDRPQMDLLSWSTLGGPGSMPDARELVTALTRTDSVPPVDEHSVNPAGFVATPTQGGGRLAQTGDRWSVSAPDMAPVEIHPSGAITDADVVRLRQLRSITIDWGRHTGPVAAVRSVAGLAAAGVPIHTSRVPRWAAALGSELIDLMTTVTSSDLDDDLRREEHSIRLRRAAMRHHSTLARWRDLTVAAGLPTPSPPRISVLLCTNRPGQIGFALRQIARQRQVDLEVVLTLHGVPAAHPDVRAASNGFDRPLTILEIPSNVVFGEALNRSVLAARGQYVAKWDDDDWYGPEFLADLSMAAHYSSADLIGCFAQLVYLQQIDLTIYRPGGDSERANRHIAGATLFMGRDDVLELGGFRPLPRSVDTALQQAVIASGGSVYRTHGLGFLCARRAGGHTWDQPLTRFIRSSARQWRGLRLGPLIADAAPAASDQLPKEAAVSHGDRR
jgi:hypothetical protein